MSYFSSQEQASTLQFSFKLPSNYTLHYCSGTVEHIVDYIACKTINNINNNLRTWKQASSTFAYLSSAQLTQVNENDVILTAYTCTLSQHYSNSTKNVNMETT